VCGFLARVSAFQAPGMHLRDEVLGIPDPSSLSFVAIAILRGETPRSHVFPSCSVHQVTWIVVKPLALPRDGTVAVIVAVPVCLAFTSPLELPWLVLT